MRVPINIIMPEASIFAASRRKNSFPFCLPMIFICWAMRIISSPCTIRMLSVSMPLPLGAVRAESIISRATCCRFSRRMLSSDIMLMMIINNGE